MRDRHYVMMRRCDGPNSDQSQLGAINDSETLLNKDIILHPIEKLVSTEKLIEYLSEKYFCNTVGSRANFSSFLLDSFSAILERDTTLVELEEPHHIISFKPFSPFQPSKNIHSGLSDLSADWPLDSYTADKNLKKSFL